MARQPRIKFTLSSLCKISHDRSSAPKRNAEETNLKQPTSKRRRHSSELPPPCFIPAAKVASYPLQYTRLATDRCAQCVYIFDCALQHAKKCGKEGLAEDIVASSAPSQLDSRQISSYYCPLVPSSCNICAKLKQTQELHSQICEYGASQKYTVLVIEEKKNASVITLLQSMESMLKKCPSSADIIGHPYKPFLKENFSLLALPVILRVNSMIRENDEDFE